MIEKILIVFLIISILFIQHHFKNLKYKLYIHDAKINIAHKKIKTTRNIEASVINITTAEFVDKEAYDQKVKELSENEKDAKKEKAKEITEKQLEQQNKEQGKEQGKNQKREIVYPKAGAILPFKRIVAYYGNFYSKKMGVLGEYPENKMLEMLNKEVKSWEDADKNTLVIPALHYIAIVAQNHPGGQKKYILRMPDDQIEKAIKIAEKIGALVFLDIQPGMSSLEEEILILEKYLKMPQVHLAIDPEFFMKDGKIPGEYIGSISAEEINFASNYLSNLVIKNDLPPKILIIHRFTKKMLTGYDRIKILPEVQIVINMDGFGEREKKISTYNYIVAPELVQFAGFKLFYKNDTKNKRKLMKPEDILRLRPRPVYIQFQ